MMIFCYGSAVDYTYPQQDNIVIPTDIKGALNSDQRNGYDIMIGTTKDEHGFREETNFWTTSHTSVYDINNEKMWITVRERYEEGPHEFTF